MNKNIFITGSCGTIGSGLVDLLLRDNTDKKILCIDNNESQLFFQEQKYLNESRVQFQYADVRDYARIKELTEGVDTIFHVAALKHVVVCERSPMDAINTNILSANNIIKVAKENNVEKVIFTSTDKAVNPTNVMGTSKLMGERLFTAANSNKSLNKSIFVSTRFGNVLGSNGSVVPIFHQQIKNGGPVTITDPEMTRFIMSVQQAVDLMINVVGPARGGEVFVTKMPTIRIIDLAEAMIEELAPLYGYEAKDISIKKIGCKPGEKLYEELMSEEETRRAIELEDYYVILPAFRGIYQNIEYEYDDIVSTNVNNPYISRNEKCMNKEEIKRILNEHSLLKSHESDSSAERYWPGDKE